MIRICFEKSLLIIDGEQDSVIFEWNHRTFFVLAIGYELDSKTKRYLFSNQKELNKVLIETIEYFDNQNLRYELDVPAKLLLDQIIDGQKNYESKKRRYSNPVD